MKKDSVMGMRIGGLLVFILAVGVGTMITAQDVTGPRPEYTLAKSSPMMVESDEKNCEYFLWTKLGGTKQRVGFTYVVEDANGKTTSEVPHVEDVTIVIDPRKTIPTAKITGTNDDNRQGWQLSMSQATHDESIRQGCLAGIATKHAK
jgi:hypothetical protein